MSIPLETDDARPVANADRRVGETSPLEDLGILQREWRKLIHDQLQLAALEMRLARWLLMAQDRANSEQMPLTHQFLADLLGVQRSAVTIAAGKLQRRKLIGYSRGQVRILSRKGLEAASCECYGIQIRDHALQFAV